MRHSAPSFLTSVHTDSQLSPTRMVRGHYSTFLSLKSTIYNVMDSVCFFFVACVCSADSRTGIGCSVGAQCGDTEAWWDASRKVTSLAGHCTLT